MTTKERVVRQSLGLTETERNQIVALLSRNPYVELLELEQTTIEQCKQLRSQGQLIQAQKLLTAAIHKKKQLLQIAERQRDSIRLIERRVQLEKEIADLSYELYWIERKNEQRQSSTST